MSLLWKTAMTWRHDPDTPAEGEPVHVRDAGFAGFTQVSFGSGDGKGEPDSQSTTIGHFIEDATPADWRAGHHGPVNLTQPIHATQSHIHTGHMDRHQRGEVEEHRGFGGPDPMFVTHQGKLHVIEGHHRVANAMRQEEPSMLGWHYDLDKHPFQCHDDCEYF